MGQINKCLYCIKYPVTNIIKCVNFFDLTQRLWQNSKINFVHFLVQMRTRKFASEIYLPLISSKLNLLLSQSRNTVCIFEYA